MNNHELFIGDDGETAYLLTRWDDGTTTLAVRPVDGGTRAVWSAPVTLTAVPAEVPC